MLVDIIETPDLGDRSYVVSDGEVAVVIDPQRDYDRVTAVLAERAVRVTHVCETHIHNDYVTGGYALAQETGATYVVAAKDTVSFERHPVSDGDTLTAGTLTVTVLETPGHTDTHVSYVVTDDSGDPPAVFSGGSLLYGSVGRTDLLGEDLTDQLTRAQFHSARKLAAELPDEAPLFPTHGFGSFCSSGGAAGGSDSTIGTEKGRNDALVIDDEEEFVRRLVEGLTGYPAYYAHMGPANLAGPQAPDLSPPTPVDPEALAQRIRAGEWVLDLRDSQAYAGRHLAGTVNMGLNDQFSTFVGWVIPWASPITLIGESPEDVERAQRQLVRIGIDKLTGAATGEVGSLAEVGVRSYRRVDFAEAAEANRGAGVQVLDVRRDDERRGGYIEGSAHIPLDQLADRLGEVPDGEVWVHCAGGYRAGIGASILDRAEHPVVHIDDAYDNAAKAGFTISKP